MLIYSSARAAPSEQYIGYLNLTIIEMNIYSLYQKSKLLNAEWSASSLALNHRNPSLLLIFSCGVPLFANAISAQCKQCSQAVSLRINPRLVGLLIDETGAVTSGKLIWSDEAWWQLLGRTAEELASSEAVLLKYLENRLLFLRVVILFGWSAEVGKLVVLRLTII